MVMNDEVPFEVFHLRDIEIEKSDQQQAYFPFLERHGLVAGLYRVAAGESDRETHGTHEQDEVYYVIRGKGKISLAGDDADLSPGSIAFVQKREVHFFHDIVEDLALLVFFSG